MAFYDDLDEIDRILEETNMPVEGKVHWSVVQTEIIEGEVHASVEMRVGSPLSPVFTTVTVRLNKGMTIEESRNAVRDACYASLRRFREKERAEGVAASLPPNGVEDFT